MHKLVGILIHKDNCIGSLELLDLVKETLDGDYYSSPVDGWMREVGNEYTLEAAVTVNLPINEINVDWDAVEIPEGKLNTQKKEIVLSLYKSQKAEGEELIRRVYDVFINAVNKCKQISLETFEKEILDEIDFPVYRLFQRNYAYLFDGDGEVISEDKVQEIVDNINDYALWLVDVHY